MWPAGVNVWFPSSIHLFQYCLKRELKAETSNFSKIFFLHSNISEVNSLKLFYLVYCFSRENYVRSWIFPAFVTSSLWAQKLDQKPAVTYDMGKDREERFRNQEKQGKHKWCTANTIMASRGTKRMLFYGAFLHVFPISYVINCKNDRRLFHSEPQC